MRFHCKYDGSLLPRVLLSNCRSKPTINSQTLLAGSRHQKMWPISTRVNKPENDDFSIIEPIALATSAA